jgi:hypothetical protein
MINVFTAKPQRAQRKALLFGGQIPPNKRVSVSEDKAHDRSRRHQTQWILIPKDAVSASIAVSRLEQKKLPSAISATLR